MLTRLVMVPYPFPNLEEAYFSNFAIFLHCCSVDVVELFSIQEACLLWNVYSLESSEALAKIFPL